MTEYWKSLPKFECKYCKVWITDNKPSREHHERGERHKEKVERKLNELRKKGMNDAKHEKFVEHSMRAMEKAALAAFRNDISNDPDLKKQYKDYNFPIPPPSKSKEKKPETTSRFEPAKSDWEEKTTVDGHTYFYNDRTGERLKRKPASNKINKQAVIENIKIEQQKKEVIDTTTGIGTWKTIVKSEPIDYDLPAKAPYLEYKKAEDNEYSAKKNDSSKFDFIEKTVSVIKKESESSSDAPAVGFKKRKMNSRSIRRKVEED